MKTIVTAITLVAFLTNLPLNLFCQANSKNNLRFIVSPYIQAVTDNSFCVMWETSSKVNGQVYLAETDRHVLKPELKLVAQEKEPALLHQLNIKELNPDELYFYQVLNISTNGDTLKGPVTQLKIPEYNHSDITFTVVGDNQGHTECWERISELMFEECPQFVIHTGDLVSYGHNKDDWTDEFFKQAQNLMRHVPLYPAIGNHEMNDEKYYSYFNHPYNNAFYTVKKGDLLLIFVDTNKDILTGSAQYRQLEETLATCKERWKIVVHHHPLFTSDIASYRSSLMARADKGDPNLFQLKNLYETYDVDIVLSGHVHGYERSHPIAKNCIDENGVVYVISAGGGGGCNKESSYKEWFTAKTKKRMHYLKVQIVNNLLTAEAIDSSGIVFDTWEKEKNSTANILNAPTISFSQKYFSDSVNVTIENRNGTGVINYRLNNELYQTDFNTSTSITIKNTTTVSAMISDMNNTSRETTKTAIKLPVMAKKRSPRKDITANYSEGYFTLLPDFEQLKPDTSFILESLSMDEVRPRAEDHFAVRFKASILVPETDVYRFFLESFDGSMLLIDNKEIIKNDGVHYEISKEGYAALEKGYHDIEVRYFDFVRRETLKIRMGKQNEVMVDINRFIK